MPGTGLEAWRRSVPHGLALWDLVGAGAGGSGGGWGVVVVNA